MEDKAESSDISEYEEVIHSEENSESVEADQPSQDGVDIEFIRVGKYHFGEPFNEIKFCGKPVYSHLKFSVKLCSLQLVGKSDKIGRAHV